MESLEEHKGHHNVHRHASVKAHIISRDKDLGFHISNGPQPELGAVFRFNSFTGGKVKEGIQIVISLLGLEGVTERDLLVVSEALLGHGFLGIGLVSRKGRSRKGRGRGGAV